jgi:hypothetical protein
VIDIAIFRWKFLIFEMHSAALKRRSTSLCPAPYSSLSFWAVGISRHFPPFHQRSSKMRTVIRVLPTNVLLYVVGDDGLSSFHFFSRQNRCKAVVNAHAF